MWEFGERLLAGTFFSLAPIHTNMRVRLAVAPILKFHARCLLCRLGESASIAQWFINMWRPRTICLSG